LIAQNVYQGERNMKKNWFTFVSLALAIALAFAFVACEQPAEEDTAIAAAVLRLYIDRPDGLTLSFKDSDILDIRAGQEIFVAPKDGTNGVEEYPYPIILKPSTNGILVPVNKSVADSDPASGKAVDGKIWKAWSAPTVTGTESGNKNNPASYKGATVEEVTSAVSNNKDRTKVIMIPPFRTATVTGAGGEFGGVIDSKIVDDGSGTYVAFNYPDSAGATIDATTGPNEGQGVGSVIQSNNPKMKFLYSGIVQLRDTAVGSDKEGVPVAYDSTKHAYYVDIPLLDKTPGSKGYDDFFKSSGSFYLELKVGPNTGFEAADAPHAAGTPINAAGGMLGYTYMYTPGKKGFNDFQGMTATGTPVWKTDNANIKKFNLKPGINEISLSDFSFVGQHDVNAKVW
jgi:hypothetical protein